MNLPQAVLFDFDGTLADTAPDLGGAANDMRVARGLKPLPDSALRPFASAGARGLLGAAFKMLPTDAAYESHRDEFLQRYEARMTQASVLFPGVIELVDALEARGLLWGIVTNKAARFTIPLVRHFGLAGRAATVVCGDTTPHTKPHPAPLLKAAEEADVAPLACWYVGDDLRDIQAARAAGMSAIAATYGYCGEIEPTTWGADAVVGTALELLGLLPKA
jgi:N-acetyl-D-muramate 6-phosphate phosphatase